MWQWLPVAPVLVDGLVVGDRVDVWALYCVVGVEEGVMESGHM